MEGNRRKTFLPALLAAQITLIVMTLFEGTKEYFLKGTLTAWQSHTITIIFTTVMVGLATTLLTDWLQRLREREKQVQIAESQLKTQKTTAASVDHLVNNLLNVFDLLESEKRDSGNVSEETLGQLEQELSKTAQKLKSAAGTENPGDEPSFNTPSIPQAE